MNELYAVLETQLENVNEYIKFCEDCEHYSERDYWIAYSRGIRDALKIIERFNKNS